MEGPARERSFASLTQENMSWDADLYVGHCVCAAKPPDEDLLVLADLAEEKGMVDVAQFLTKVAAQQACPNKLAPSSWNYTHNTNPMIRAAIGDLEVEDHFVVGPVWWKWLDKKTSLDGAMFLGDIVRVLEADPAKFRAMNPPNG